MASAAPVAGASAGGGAGVGLAGADLAGAGCAGAGLAGAGLDAAGFAGAGLAGAEVLRGAATPGINTIAPHCGHFPFLPAAASGVRTNWWHAGQENSMGMSS